MQDFAENRRLTPSAALWVALACGLSIGIQNLWKPVHIDDALYLHIARQIVRHPTDPYSGPINWQQTTQPAYKVSISPPLVSYQFALVIALVGESQVALHASMIPWMLLATWGIFRLGQRFCDRPLEATLAVILAPAVVVGLNLMLDVPLLACFVATIETSMRFADTRRWRWAASAVGWGAAAVLVKFAGIVLAPLAVVMAIDRRNWRPLIAAIGPIVAYVAWQKFSEATYGMGQADQGLGFLERFKFNLLQMAAERIATMALLLAMTMPAWFALASCLGPRKPELRAGVKTRQPGMLTLVAWVGGTAAFVILFGPFVAVRSFLPIHPPLVWLIVRAIQNRKAGLILLRISIVATAILSGLLQWADWRWAAIYPRTAAIIEAKYGHETKPVLFLGHWGWQYYCERAGFVPWEANQFVPPVGALMLVPTRPDRQSVYPDIRRLMKTIDVFETPPHPLWLTTWNRLRRIRFYGGDFGELPWGFCFDPTERIAVCEITDQPAETPDPLLFPPALERQWK